MKACILMVLTLGNAVDAKIRYYKTIGMTQALILDGCATADVEELSDNLCNEIERKISYRDKKQFIQQRDCLNCNKCLGCEFRKECDVYGY